jgi:hypothetical protein
MFLRLINWVFQKPTNFDDTGGLIQNIEGMLGESQSNLLKASKSSFFNTTKNSNGSFKALNKSLCQATEDYVNQVMDIKKKLNSGYKIEDSDLKKLVDLKQVCKQSFEKEKFDPFFETCCATALLVVAEEGFLAAKFAHITWFAGGLPYLTFVLVALMWAYRCLRIYQQNINIKYYAKQLEKTDDNINTLVVLKAVSHCKEWFEGLDEAPLAGWYDKPNQSKFGQVSYVMHKDVGGFINVETLFEDMSDASCEDEVVDVIDLLKYPPSEVSSPLRNLSAKVQRLIETFDSLKLKPLAKGTQDFQNYKDAIDIARRCW